MTKAPEIIRELVELFDCNIKAYRSPSYKEEQLKHDFLNRFFKALGWDLSNKKRAAPQYRDVIFEDSIKVAGGTKAPDYCFTLSGKRMFFVEAKKPYVYILGLLNSKLLDWFLNQSSSPYRGGYYSYNRQYIENIPIRLIDFSNPAEKAQHDKLVALVENMLELQKRYHEARMERDKELFERRIKGVDAQIDQLVYELYGLTEDEIEIVEQAK